MTSAHLTNSLKDRAARLVTSLNALNVLLIAKAAKYARQVLLSMKTSNVDRSVSTEQFIEAVIKIV